MVSLCGKFLQGLEGCSKNIKRFILNCRSFTEFIFIVIYLLEQLFLIGCVLIFSNSIQIVVSIFVAFALSTFAVEKLCMKSQMKALEEKINKYLFAEKEILIRHTQEMEEVVKEICESYEKYSNKETQDLNNKKDMIDSVRGAK